LGITIACHCDLFSIPAFFGSGYVAPASFLNNNMNKGRWTQGKHMIFMQEYEKYGNNCMQIAKVLSTRTAAQIKKHAECFFEQNENKFCSSQTVSRVPLSQWEKLKPWSKMVLNKTNIDNLSHLKTKFKSYA
jgi:hypothetical protein